MEGGTVSNHAETRPPAVLSFSFWGGWGWVRGWEDEGKEQGREKPGKGEKGASWQGQHMGAQCQAQRAACRSPAAGSGVSFPPYSDPTLPSATSPGAGWFMLHHFGSSLPTRIDGPGMLLCPPHGHGASRPLLSIPPHPDPQCHCLR